MFATNGGAPLSCFDRGANMYTVIITGGIGSGKSELTRILCEDFGATSLDLDAVAHSLLEGNDSMIQELVERFGQGILDEDGMVVREKLARRAFDNEQATQDMNDITFPYIIEVATDAILGCSCAPLSDAKCQIIEVPLLDKAPELANLADEIIAVVAEPRTRLTRAVKRGMDKDDAMRRYKAQIDDASRIELADTVCTNEGSIEDLKAWAKNWWNARFSVLDLGDSTKECKE